MKSQIIKELRAKTQRHRKKKKKNLSRSIESFEFHLFLQTMREILCVAASLREFSP